MKKQTRKLLRKGQNPKLAAHFCKCIKSVAPKFGGPSRGEAPAIAICVKSILQSKGRTLKRFKCKKGASITTQRMKRKSKRA